MKIKTGVYERFKGKRYEVIGVAKNSETLEEVVAYRALYGEHDFWVRPIAMFLGQVELKSGRRVERFKYLCK